MHEELSCLRRARLLEAMAAEVAERGFEAATVAGASARAGLSQRSFYREFEDRKQCFLGLIDWGEREVIRVVSEALGGGDNWQDRVREALASLLLFFDSEPDLAWVWLVESSTAGGWALERRHRGIANLTALIVSRLDPPVGAGSHPLAAEAVMNSLVGVVQSHLVARRCEPLISLLGPLMGVVVAPYLPPEAVTAAVERGARRAREVMDPSAEGRCEPPEPVEIPRLLLDPRAHRARSVVLFLAENRGASNREIADSAGVKSQAQISTLLSRLEKAGLLEKSAGKPGHPNRWSLSSAGERVVSGFGAGVGVTLGARHTWHQGGLHTEQTSSHKSHLLRGPRLSEINP